ncbi:sensor histidine kinase [Mobilicoccus pelagius]|uniref:histidine kinase n=1 Tax=Mobilicoccus pelagius NBRC 104925 TaxID=1089455 RepID=H5UNY5_9MICO|nr:HAMP domain-containing sensor histidine kinase [Mobilicoccus pelagius]GAB47443.1 putative histidine kinase [Mobilicoccus pelagius NBRC 104925]
MTTGADDVFRHLRVRLTAIFAAVAVVGLAALVALLVVLDSEFDRERVDTILRGVASRAAALVYQGEDGRATGEGLRGDLVETQASGLLVVERTGTSYRTVYASGEKIRGDWRPVAQACLDDAAESGTYADIGDLRVTGMPWWLTSKDPRPRGCAFAFVPRRSLLQAHVALPAALGSATLLAVLTGLVWWAAGRSLRVASEALADRERFLATASHEMRGPLARMRAVAETTLHALAPGQPQTAAGLRSLVTTADQAGRVASNLLLATRIDHAEVPVHLLPVRLDVLACEVETIIDGVVVDVTEPVEVSGDAMLLRQAMTNLVDNAMRHGRGGETRAEVLLSVFRDGDVAVVRVADDGPGFPADLDVLSPYVAGRTGGNGLGLPLVRWIVERHGGEMRIGAAEGRDGLDGAAVELRIPQ